MTLLHHGSGCAVQNTLDEGTCDCAAGPGGANTLRSQLRAAEARIARLEAVVEAAREVSETGALPIHAEWDRLRDALAALDKEEA